MLKISSKIQLIKSKCMKVPPSLVKSDSKKTFKSMWMGNEQLNGSGVLLGEGRSGDDSTLGGVTSVGDGDSSVECSECERLGHDELLTG